jgi:hypothetical protein
MSMTAKLRELESNHIPAHISNTHRHPQDKKHPQPQTKTGRRFKPTTTAASFWTTAHWRMDSLCLLQHPHPRARLPLCLAIYVNNRLSRLVPDDDRAFEFSPFRKDPTNLNDSTPDTFKSRPSGSASAEPYT